MHTKWTKEGQFRKKRRSKGRKGMAKKKALYIKIS